MTAIYGSSTSVHTYVEPTMEQLFTIVVTRIAAKWKYLARNKSFFTVSSHQPHLANEQWSCLEVQTQASGNSNLCLVMFWKPAVSRPGLMSHQHLQFLLPVCSGHRWLLCTYHLIFLIILPLTCEPDCHPDTRSDT